MYQLDRNPYARRALTLWERLCAALDALQEKTGLDIPIHVDGASGAMVALLVRNPDVLSFHQNSHFLGHSTLEVICYVIIWALQLLIIQKGMETVRKFQDWAGPAVWIAMLILAIGLTVKAGGFSFDHGIPMDVLLDKTKDAGVTGEPGSFSSRSSTSRARAKACRTGGAE